MRGALRIARVFGIDIAVHWSFLLLVGYAAIGSAGGGPNAALFAVGYLGALFICITLHELGHALTARAYGVRTRHITLLPIGGVAALERMPTKPVQEMLIAIAGPAVNVAIAALLLAISLLVGDVATPDTALTVENGDLLKQLAFINGFLVAFNMLPAFPMDGGRVLRALLALKLSHARASVIAARTGQAIAVGFAALALLGGQPFLLLIAAFVFFAGQSEVNSAVQRGLLDRATVADAMLTDFRVLPPEASLSAAADMARGGLQQDFPVLDEDTRLHGMLTRLELAQALHQDVDPAAPIANYLNRHPVTVDESAPLLGAIEDLRHRSPAAAVVRDDVVVGLLTPESIGAFMQRAATRRSS